MALVAPDEVEKNNSPLYSCQGEVLASRKDFRMNTCTPDPRGSFMLDPVGMCPVEPSDLCPMPGSQKDAEGAEGQLMEVSRNGSHVSILNISQEPEGPMLSGGDEDAEDVAELQEVALEPAEPRTSQQSATLPRRYMLRERQGNPEPASRLQETPDPWQSLDPFDSLNSKVFQKGKPFSVPPGMEEPPGHKRKRKGATKLQDFHQWYLAAYADHADSRRPRLVWMGKPLIRSLSADMEVLYWKHVREQLESLQKLRRQKMTESWLPGAKEDLWPVEEEPDDFLEPEEYVEREEVIPGEAELFIATSQKFVQETELSQRIRDWEDTIQPLLQEQEQHVPFDIHTYGDQLVSRFPQLNEWCPFAELVAGQPAFEVCRSMLASLQLANDYTVEITQQPGLESAVDTMSLRLLTHQRAHTRFQTYAAPSMVQP
ncbi:Condensin-2 complex subunit H2 [Lemmus lemmus]